MHSSPIDAKAIQRVAARLKFLEEDPLEYWDLGMVFAFDVIARRLQDIAGVNQIVTMSEVLRLIAAEKREVLASELHGFLDSIKKTPEMPGITCAARMAVVRSNKQRRKRREFDPHSLTLTQPRTRAAAAGI